MGWGSAQAWSHDGTMRRWISAGTSPYPGLHPRRRWASRGLLQRSGALSVGCVPGRYLCARGRGLVMIEPKLYFTAKRAVTAPRSLAKSVQRHARRAQGCVVKMRAAQRRVYCEQRLGELSAAGAADANKGGRLKTSQEWCEVPRVQVAKKPRVPESTLRKKGVPVLWHIRAALRADGQDDQGQRPPTPRRAQRLQLNQLRDKQGFDRWCTALAHHRNDGAGAKRQ